MYDTFGKSFARRECSKRECENVRERTKDRRKLFTWARESEVMHDLYDYMKGRKNERTKEKEKERMKRSKEEKKGRKRAIGQMVQHDPTL